MWKFHIGKAEEFSFLLLLLVFPNPPPDPKNRHKTPENLIKVNANLLEKGEPTAECFVLCERIQSGKFLVKKKAKESRGSSSSLAGIANDMEIRYTSRVHSAVKENEKVRIVNKVARKEANAE